MSTIKRVDEIIVHCTATKEGRDVTVEEVDKWHKQNGWEGIGYHYLVYLDGSVHAGRLEYKSGAHCQGHNHKSIGVCYVGGCDKNMKPKDTRTDAQKIGLRAILKELKSRYPHAKIYGHRDFAAKACPSFDAQFEYRDI